MFQIPRSLAVAAAGISAAASLVASAENVEKNQSDFRLIKHATLDELIISDMSFNAISREKIDSAQQSAIKAAKGLSSLISSNKSLVDRFPEIERPDYEVQSQKLRQDLEKLSEVYRAGDWDALQKGSEEAIRSIFKLQNSINEDSARGEALSRMLAHASEISLSYGTEQQPAVVKEVLQKTLDANEAFRKGSNFDFNLVALQKSVEELPSRDSYNFGNFIKTAGLVVTGVATAATICYHFPKVIEAADRRKHNKELKETAFLSQCKNHTDKIDILKKNLSISETMLQQIGQIRYIESKVTIGELDLLSSRAVALHEMNDALVEAYEKLLEPILKTKDRSKAESALNELDNKLSTSNLVSDYRHGTILGVGVQASFKETYDAICEAYKNCTADFDKIILKLKQAA